MRRLVVFSWLLLAVFISGSAFARTENPDPWKETGIDFTLIEHLANEAYPCAKTEKNFLACVQMINTLGAFQEPRQVFMPKGYPGAEAASTNIRVLELGTFELLQWTAPATPAPSALAAVKEKKALFAAMQNASQETFPTSKDFDFVSLARQLVASAKIPTGLSQQAVLAAAANGLIQSIDGHGHFESTAEMTAMAAEADISLVGIGVGVDSVPEGVLIIEVHENGPAEAAKMQAGDIIIEIDGRSAQGIALEVAIPLIRGTQDSWLDLKVRRKGQEIALRVQRKKVVVKNVQLKIVEDFPGFKVANIRLGSFVDKSACTSIAKMLRELPIDVHGVVLDMRSNGGGLIDQAVCIGGLFVGQMPITIVRNVYPNGQTDFRGELLIPEGPENLLKATALPVVVMINGNSASASELVAGALRDYQRAFVLGTRSFGKGSVQNGGPYHLFNGKIMLFTTIARFYQPLGSTNQQVGIEPDFEVFARPDMSEEERFERREGDLFFNALDGIGKPWTQKRSEEIAALKSGCMAADRAKAIYNERKETIGKGDYQLYAAQELLACEFGDLE